MTTSQLVKALPTVGTDPAGTSGDPQIQDPPSTVAPTVGECQLRHEQMQQSGGWLNFSIALSSLAEAAAAIAQTYLA